MRVGVIGCGQHATAVVLPTAISAGFDVVATCARRHEQAAAAARRFRVPSAYDDVQELFDRDTLDAVLVSTPPSIQAAITTSAVEAGLPVLVEKPGAATAAEADVVARLSARTGVPVMVGYMKRFAPAYRRARACIEEESFGPASLARFEFVMGEFDDDLLGYLLDNTVHHLDLARFLLGELVDISPTLGSTGPGRYALVASARSAAGAAVGFQFGTTGSWTHHNESVEVYGIGASVFVDNVDTCVLRGPSPGEHRWRPNYSIPMEQNDGSTVAGFRPELLHFRDVVVDHVPCESDMTSAARTLGLAEAMVSALR